MNQQPQVSLDEAEIEARLQAAMQEISEPPAIPAPVKRAPAPAPAATVRPIARTADEDVSRFLHTAERMVTTIRAQMEDTQSRYNIERATLADGFRRRMADLEVEAREALRDFDSKHRAESAKRQRMLEALMAMRDA